MPTSSHSFLWKADSILFRSWRGSDAEPAGPGDILQQATLTQDVPRPGGENARMNLWLFNGRAPAVETVEVIVKRFEFVPAP